MKTILLTATVLALGSAPLQDTPAKLVEKLKSADKDEAENARTALLELGEPALPTLRDAAAKAGDEGFKKLLNGMIERLETRKGAARLVKSWGDRWFSLYLKDLHAGWAHLTVEEKEGQLYLTDNIYIKRGDQEAMVRVSLKAQPNEYLSPIEVVLDAKSAEYTGKVEAKVKDGRIIAFDGEEKKAVRVPPNLTTDLSVLRLATVLPKSEGYELTVLQTVKPKLIENAVLKFDQEESIDYEGKKVKTRRYRLIEPDAEEDKVYWVDATGRLLRFHIGVDVVVLLSDEKRAKDLD